MLIFDNSAVGYENWYCFITTKFGVQKRGLIGRDFKAGISKFYGYINISIFLSKSEMQHLCHRENNVCNVLVPIKVVLIKNDYSLHPKFELHTYQQMNGFLYWRSFHWKKYGSYISHELIVQLIPTWIWFDLLTIIHIWPSNHQLSYFF